MRIMVVVNTYDIISHFFTPRLTYTLWSYTRTCRTWSITLETLAQSICERRWTLVNTCIWFLFTCDYKLVIIPNVHTYSFYICTVLFLSVNVYEKVFLFSCTLFDLSKKKKNCFQENINILKNNTFNITIFEKSQSNKILQLRALLII